LKANQLIALLVFCLSALTAHARTNANAVGARAAAMCNSVVSQYDTWSTMHNPAGLAAARNYEAGIYYENRFFVPELSLRAITITAPTQRGNFTGTLSIFGPNAWHETDASLGYSLKLSEKLSAGTQLNYYAMKLPEQNQSIFTLSASVGAIFRASERTSIGLSIANPYTPPLNTASTSQKIPWRVLLGGSTNFAKPFQLAYEVEKTAGEPLLFKTGAEWEAAENFFFRFGLNSRSRFACGFGYRMKYLKTDVAFSYHPYLGYTPSVSLIALLP
jgi:hypothetical protein